MSAPHESQSITVAGVPIIVQVSHHPELGTVTVDIQTPWGDFNRFWKAYPSSTDTTTRDEGSIPKMRSSR